MENTASRAAGHESIGDLYFATSADCILGRCFAQICAMVAGTFGFWSYIQYLLPYCQVLVQKQVYYKVVEF